MSARAYMCGSIRTSLSACVCACVHILSGPRCMFAVLSVYVCVCMCAAHVTGVYFVSLYIIIVYIVYVYVCIYVCVFLVLVSSSVCFVNDVVLLALYTGFILHFAFADFFSSILVNNICYLLLRLFYFIGLHLINYAFIPKVYKFCLSFIYYPIASSSHTKSILK